MVGSGTEPMQKKCAKDVAIVYKQVSARFSDVGVTHELRAEI